jgi:hypothetical protein
VKAWSAQIATWSRPAHNFTVAVVASSLLRDSTLSAAAISRAALPRPRGRPRRAVQWLSSASEVASGCFGVRISDKASGIRVRVGDEGLPALAAPVAGFTLSNVPSSETASPTGRRTDCERSAPPSALGGDRFVPAGEGVSAGVTRLAVVVVAGAHAFAAVT